MKLFPKKYARGALLSLLALSFAGNVFASEQTNKSTKEETNVKKL